MRSFRHDDGFFTCKSAKTGAFGVVPVIQNVPRVDKDGWMFR
jgi:hypothetical protein